ncbi:MAG: Sua5/YciO/YrdC/YwlC family protein, partial [Alphaproteobacteria bacterium]|nr:Sua5/YciO/YrdC/YwlC family protein [Alphaproteobacteria bacterium]
MTTAFQIRQAALALRAGGVVAYPTEAVFGIGCDPLNPHAVAQLLALKRRPFDKGLILLAAHRSQLDYFVADLPPDVEDRVAPTWPGPVTWVLPARPATPEWITGGRDTVAVRVTAHPVAKRLSAAAGMA